MSAQIMSEELLLPEPLSAKNKGSFAYNTVKDRLPVILTKVIDLLCREKDTIATQYGGNDALESIKMIVAQLSQLKNEMQTNKPIQLLGKVESFTFDDTSIWNEEHQIISKQQGELPRWFTSSWLYVECFLYKKIHDVFRESSRLKEYDPFMHQKTDALKLSMTPVESLITHVLDIINTKDLVINKTVLEQMLEISLWGNQCDLSISAGNDNHRETNLISSLESLRSQLLVNDSDHIWNILSKQDNKDSSHLDLILDNAGFELITDLCLLTYLMETKTITSAAIHVKTRPWFVSDTTKNDVNFTMQELRKSNVCGKIVSIWSNYFEEGKWTIAEYKFWTTSISFSRMNEVDPQLYKNLSSSKLIIFKGDLNYRKLVGDLDWPNNTDFSKALCGFRPSPLVVLRTAKGGPVVGLPDDKIYLASQIPDWYYSGNFGMIQFSKL